ncbi:MAG TPA: ribonuclease D [Nitrospira sp.]|nr:ribonuclease D [Nitrospira sp.]MCW5795956.1 ribonuclease D [Nitrospira sp.]HMU30371.1 ribonuclease D [Nitrospira sp.]HMV57047.1 ribonuclease D [Nitrospira sp.]HMX91797.1 ribonuclease D [Nitrospira sp.]
MATLDPDQTFITSDHMLDRLCDQLANSAVIAIDTEFMGEDHFIPRLELIQVAAEGVAAVIDFPAVQDSAPMVRFWELVCDARIEKVLHAGRQDLELFAHHAGRLPKPFFDTQIAAAMVGYGAQTAYANLVQRVQGVKLDKAHTFTNWSQRPLSKDQLVYALDDVTFLLPIHRHLRQKLSVMGRLDWVDEEFSRLEVSLGAQARDPQERYQRIRGWDSLKPRAAGVLRDLAAWREGEARRRNVPRGRVMRDEVLVQLARQTPRTLDQLRGMRGMYSSEVERNGQALLATMQQALARPESEWPEVPRDRKPDPESTGVLELLQAVLKSRAAMENIAPTLIATTGDLQALVERTSPVEEVDIPVLRGWRRQLVGETLLSVLSGNLKVWIDPQIGKLRFGHLDHP